MDLYDYAIEVRSEATYYRTLSEEEIETIKEILSKNGIDLKEVTQDDVTFAIHEMRNSEKGFNFFEEGMFDEAEEWVTDYGYVGPTTFGG